MKLIDILNMIANGDEIPDEIIVDGRTYVAEDGIFTDFCNEQLKVNLFNLNANVIIPANEKKIDKLTDCYIATSNNDIKLCVENINILSNKINEIIDYLNVVKGIVDYRKKEIEEED